ncbi:MAG: type II secretion system minor pseudopilin GspI [Proteobacteria bacterium]|nr:type II secretion system minor pseudopilin GspI [Pseudomonadota bacterium]
MTSPARKHSRGFTLVEVMVALAVVAIALPALMFSLHQQIDGTLYLRDKSIAHIVAANKLAEVRIMAKAKEQLLKGKDGGTTTLADRDWDWQLNSAETELPNFYRVEINVSAVGVEPGAPLYTLVGFLSADLNAEDDTGGAGG